jgi:2',3'-cyclic-nucleotide 2'-phosphodiesterase / 3'-nucleotidase
MMTKFTRLIICGLIGITSQLAASEIELRVLETTDLHMNLLSYDYYLDTETDKFGLAKTVSLIKKARREVTNSMLFDNGDLLQGSPLGDYVAKIKPLKLGAVHPAFKVMNQMRYDAGNLGNHDFNYGLDFLRQATATANFPYVNANIYLDSTGQKPNIHAFTPYVILSRRFKDRLGAAHTLKVGVLGLAPPQIMQWDRSNLLGRVTARDMVEVAQLYVPKMRAEGADLVIVIAHSGFEKTLPGAKVPSLAENAVAQLVEIPGINAVLFGHAHAEFPSPAFADYPKVDIVRGTINGVAAVMPGRWGDHLGVIDFTLDNQSGTWRVRESTASIRPIFDNATKTSLAASDPMVAKVIRTEHQATLAYVRAKVATISAPIYSYFAQVTDDASVQVVANAQIAFMKKAVEGTQYAAYPVLSAAAPFKTGGRQGTSYYTDIPKGTLAIKNIADLYFYPNTVKGMLLTGAEVRDWIEMSAGQFNTIDPKGPPQQALINSAYASFNFDVIDGLSYTLDLTKPAKYSEAGVLIGAKAGRNRVTQLKYNGKAIDLNAKFIVASNNYRAYGGGNFPGLSAAKVVVDAPTENREALIQYLLAHPTFNPSADNNWHIRLLPGIQMTFESATVAKKYLLRQSNIKAIKDNGDGTTLFALGR